MDAVSVIGNTVGCSEPEERRLQAAGTGRGQITRRHGLFAPNLLGCRELHGWFASHLGLLAVVYRLICSILCRFPSILPHLAAIL
jgi:hypothetical protein